MQESSVSSALADEPVAAEDFNYGDLFPMAFESIAESFEFLARLQGGTQPPPLTGNGGDRPPLAPSHLAQTRAGVR